MRMNNRALTLNQVEARSEPFSTSPVTIYNVYHMCINLHLKVAPKQICRLLLLEQCLQKASVPQLFRKKLPHLFFLQVSLHEFKDE